jgi:hypothetical protein
MNNMNIIFSIISLLDPGIYFSAVDQFMQFIHFANIDELPAH